MSPARIWLTALAGSSHGRWPGRSSREPPDGSRTFFGIGSSLRTAFGRDPPGTASSAAPEPSSSGVARDYEGCSLRVSAGFRRSTIARPSYRPCAIQDAVRPLRPHGADDPGQMTRSVDRPRKGPSPFCVRRVSPNLTCSQTGVRCHPERAHVRNFHSHTSLRATEGSLSGRARPSPRSRSSPSVGRQGPSAGAKPEDETARTAICHFEGGAARTVFHLQSLAPTEKSTLGGS
jgi:hypothetical protein